MVNSCKYLGLVIDDKLRWDDHIKYIYKKLIKFVSIFYKLRYKLNQTGLKNVYFAFVHPHLLYGVELYGTANSTSLDKLVKLNNKILRILQFKDKKSHVSELYINFNTLQINSLCDMQLLSLVNKFYHHKDLLPTIYKDYFTSNSSVHTHNTRLKEGLHVERYRTNYGQKTIKYRGPKLWNSLPQSLKEPCSTKLFKINYKKFILNCPQ